MAGNDDFVTSGSAIDQLGKPRFGVVNAYLCRLSHLVKLDQILRSGNVILVRNFGRGSAGSGEWNPAQDRRDPVSLGTRGHGVGCRPLCLVAQSRNAAAASSRTR